MNLRDIKKDIEYVVGEFVDDCSLFISMNPDKATDEVMAVVEDAVNLYNDLKDKAAAKVEGKKSAYFDGIRKEMLQKVDALYEKLSDIIAAQKK